QRMQHAERADMDNFPCAVTKCRADDIPCPEDGPAIEFFGPSAHCGAEMKNRRRAGNCSIHRVSIAQIADNQLDIGILDKGSVGRDAPNQKSHSTTILQQPIDEGPPDESCSPRNERSCPWSRAFDRLSLGFGAVSTGGDRFRPSNHKARLP